MNERETVLELLRAAIWDRKPEVKEADWDCIAKLAMKLTVLPLVADRILKLEPENLSDETRVKIRKHLLSAAGLSNKQQSVMVNVFEKMENAGLEPVLLKGYYNATAYPEPCLRPSGDIDIFVSEERLEDAVRTVFDQGQRLKYEEKHAQGIVDGVSIEIHWISTRMSKKRTAAIYSGYEKEYLKRGYGSVNVLGYEIAVPDPTFHVLFLACHTWRHFLLAGATIRQFCDICLFLEKYRDSIDTAKLREMIVSIGFMPMWRLFMSVCTDVLGYDPSKTPFYRKTPKWKIEYTKSLIFSDSDYGYNVKEAKDKIWIINKIHSLCLWTGQFLRILPLFPLTTIRIYCWLMFNQLVKNLSTSDAGTV